MDGYLLVACGTCENESVRCVTNKFIWYSLSGITSERTDEVEKMQIIRKTIRLLE